MVIAKKYTQKAKAQETFKATIVDHA